MRMQSLESTKNTIENICRIMCSSVVTFMLRAYCERNDPGSVFPDKLQAVRSFGGCMLNHFCFHFLYFINLEKFLSIYYLPFMKWD